MGMIDWGPVADQARRTCGACLNDLFAVAAAAPEDPRVPVLDEVAALLGPAALQARMRQVPPYHPRRGPLGERARVCARPARGRPGHGLLPGRGAGRAAGLGPGPLAPAGCAGSSPQPQRRGPRARGRVLPAGPAAARPFRADDRESGGARHHRGVRRVTAPGRGRRRSRLVRRRGRDHRAGPGRADQHRLAGRAGHRGQHRDQHRGQRWAQSRARSASRPHVRAGRGPDRGAGQRRGDPRPGRPGARRDHPGR